MGLEQKITCDSCNRDITYTSNSEDWRISVKNEKIPCVGGAVTAMSAFPPLEQNFYFCGFMCLMNYFVINKN